MSSGILNEHHRHRTAGCDCDKEKTRRPHSIQSGHFNECQEHCRYDDVVHNQRRGEHPRHSKHRLQLIGGEVQTNRHHHEDDEAADEDFLHGVGLTA